MDIETSKRVTTSTLRRAIRRRVWYSFFVGIITHRAIISGFGFGASLMLFRDLVFVRAVIDNLLLVELGKVPRYIVASVTHTDIATLLSMACMSASLWLLWRYIRGNGVVSLNQYRMVR